MLARRGDVADCEAIRASAADVHESVGAIDLLVNTPGIVLIAGFSDTTLDAWDWIVRITRWASCTAVAASCLR